MGGLIEPFAFGGLAPPTVALPVGVTSGLLALPSLPPQPFALENATFASSNFPAEAPRPRHASATALHRSTAPCNAP